MTLPPTRLSRRTVLGGAIALTTGRAAAAGVSLPELRVDRYRIHGGASILVFALVGKALDSLLLAAMRPFLRWQDGLTGSM